MTPADRLGESSTSGKASGGDGWREGREGRGGVCDWGAGVLRVSYSALEVRACFSPSRWDRSRRLESLMSWNFLGMFLFYALEMK